MAASGVPTPVVYVSFFSGLTDGQRAPSVVAVVVFCFVHYRIRAAIVSFLSSTLMVTAGFYIRFR